MEVYEKEKGNYHSITNNSMSLCRVLEKTTSNPMVKMLLTELMKFSNLPTACPMKKASLSISTTLFAITYYLLNYRTSII